MLLLSVLHLDEAFFRYVTQADAVVAQGAHQAFLACSFLPFLSAASSYVKGILTALKVTMARLKATVVSIGVLGLVLFVGVQLKWPGVVTAAVAVSMSLLADLAVMVVHLWSRSSNSVRGQENSA